MTLHRRIHVDRGAWPLAAGDVLVLALVFAGGVAHHNGVAHLSNQPLDTLVTVAPFLAGWLLVAPLVGAYSAGAAESAKAAIPLALRAWVPAGLLAVLLRTATDGGIPEPVFVGVTLVAGGVGLAAWRWLRFRL